MNHPETQEMDIALHSLAFMLSHPALAPEERHDIEDVMQQMIEQRDSIEREIDDIEQEADIGRIGWREAPRSDEDEEKRQYRQMLRNARWN